MVIALNELLKDIENSKHCTLDVKCAVIGLSFGYVLDDNPEYILSNPNNICTDEPMFDKIITLKENWSNDEWLAFLEGLRFNYDDGFGSQHLFGVVWFKDGSWLEREEYDGSEGWILKRTPDVPLVLQRW
jgi:prophage pi3 protein 38-like sequence|nr:MAG TPA: hypothetical protein [Caudoviricetes sp.]